jgi:hypothetical protein
MSIVVSTEDRRAVVIRNGVEIGRTRISIPAGFEIGTRVLQFEGFGDDGKGRWTYIGLPGYEERKGQAVEVEALQKIQMPPEFLAKVREAIVPGTMLMATDGGLVEGHTGKELKILTNS